MGKAFSMERMFVVDVGVEITDDIIAGASNRTQLIIILAVVIIIIAVVGFIVGP
jgi:hypothetical protein